MTDRVNGPGEPSLNTWRSREYYSDYLVINSKEAFKITGFLQLRIKKSRSSTVVFDYSWHEYFCIFSEQIRIITEQFPD